MILSVEDEFRDGSLFGAIQEKFGQALAERGRFIWPHAQDGSVSLTAAQLSMLLEGIDWRHPVRTADPLMEL